MRISVILTYARVLDFEVPDGLDRESIDELVNCFGESIEDAAVVTIDDLEHALVMMPIRWDEPLDLSQKPDVIATIPCNQNLEVQYSEFKVPEEQ